MKLQDLKRRVQADEPAALLDEVIALVDEALRHARDYVHELSPGGVLDRGFTAAVRWLAERMESEHGPLLLVLVGALNVGRIRVQGVDPHDSGVLAEERELQRGEELARFELGSTIVLLTPAGMAAPLPDLKPHDPVRLGQAIGRYA